MEFRCRLGTPGGEIIEGLYVADSEARLRREFEEKGLYVLGLHRAGRARFAGIALPRRARIATREFVVFNQELATLLKAGMPLVQSLDILRRRATNPVFKAVLDDVNDRVRAGSSLSESFEAHGALFPGVYTASLLAGEKSGNLEQVIRRYVSYVKVVANVKRKTVSALVYPLILLALSMVVVSIIMLRVVPAFGEFYSQFGEELPLSTRVIVAISSFASSYFLPIVIVVALVAVGAWQWLQRPGKREWFDRMVLRLPGLGGIAQKFATSQAARTLATMLWVALFCCSTAAEIEPAMPLMRSMVWLIALMAATDSSVASCMLSIWLEISSVALAVWPASVLTSWATTAKPRPASPARAASMVAFSANRLVCSAIEVISLTTSPMRAPASESCAIR